MLKPLIRNLPMRAPETKLKAAFKAVTGNRLIDGDVVWMMKDGGWTLNMLEAAAFPAEDAEAALAQGASQPTLVTGVYLIAFEPGIGPVGKEKWREEIRARGPTVRRDLGKQAHLAQGDNI